jgi:polysaccharide biosynthesis/export protein
MFFFKKIQKYFIITILTSVMIGALCIPSISWAQEDPEEYKIGVGDILRINTWKEPDLSLEDAMVRSDGKITFPLLDDIQAQGSTTMELKAKIEKMLAEYVEAPNVTITLANPASQRFYILGEVVNTGEYPITKKLTVMQAFALAGGFTEWASKNNILLIRRSEGQKTTVTIKYKDILKGDFSKDIALKADDTIIVP